MGFVGSFATCWRELGAFVFLCLNEFSNAKIRTENLRKSFVCSSAVEILGIRSDVSRKFRIFTTIADSTTVWFETSKKLIANKVSNDPLSL